MTTFSAAVFTASALVLVGVMMSEWVLMFLEALVLELAGAVVWLAGWFLKRAWKRWRRDKKDRQEAVEEEETDQT